jgi:hypothetical protein
MSAALRVHRYRATAKDQYGQEVIATFVSNVEYIPGDELPLRRGVRWLVQTVEQEGIARIDGEDQGVRELRCVLQ